MTEIVNVRHPVAIVVDDEPVVRMDTADMVEDEGFEVIEAKTVDAAFELLKQFPSIRLVVTDTQTPGAMTGCELAWEISRRWPSVCVVVASGSGRPEDNELPATAIYVAKPLSADVVHEAVEEYCRNCDVR